MSTHFKNFYVLISNNPFGSMNLTDARANASYEYFQGNLTPERKISLNNLNERGRYVRIQAIGSNRIIKLAEVEIIGKKYVDPLVLNTPDETLITIQVYPNPTSGSLMINLNRSYKNINVKVTNLLGQQIIDENYRDVTQLPLIINQAAGVYFFEINSDAEGLSEVFKIIKK